MFEFLEFVDELTVFVFSCANIEIAKANINKREAKF
jgi:hypothetical protein